MINDKVDFTYLKPQGSMEDVRAFLEQAKKYKPYAVCVFPQWTVFARDVLSDTGIKICTVIGFPFGHQNVAIKMLEADIESRSADELDVVMNIGDFKSGNYEAVLYELKQMRKICKNKVLKVIIETCYLTTVEIMSACKICLEAKVDFIKTSTGYGTRGATPEDIRIIKNEIVLYQSDCKIKASGGIKTTADAVNLIYFGADRIGSSAEL